MSAIAGRPVRSYRLGFLVMMVFDAVRKSASSWPGRTHCRSN